MSKLIQQAFGTWDSPISPEMVTTAGVRLGDVAYSDGAVFWSEARPSDGGRSVIVKRVSGQAAVDVTAAPFNVRTRVHEYGGGAWWVDTTYAYFVNWEDQRLYRVRHAVGVSSEPGMPEALTSEPSVAQSLRYADGCVSPDGAWIACVRERHIDKVVYNELVLIPNTVFSADRINSSSVIVTGADFYSTPRFSGNGKHLSWVQWSHPQMPWDGTTLMVADVAEDGSVANERAVCGDSQTSVMGGMWTAKNELVYASDESGWWNLYRFRVDDGRVTTLTQFTDREVGTPAWLFGTQRFVELPDGGLGMVVTQNAADQLFVLTTAGEVVEVDTPYCAVSGIVAADNGVVLHAHTDDGAASVVLLEIDSTGDAVTTVIKAAEPLAIDKAWLSTPEAIRFPSGDRVAHAFFYPPAGLGLSGLEGELPPLIVMGHGGPTSHATSALKLSVQYWTSRGVAVVDVNYGGSSGFGRDYRRLLNGQWGVVDVEDCVAATAYLSGSGRVDGDRMVIRGGSAGGLTVLRALQTSDRFAGGTSLYGVADLEMLAGDTHKFESRYLDGLLGGAYPEHKAVYVERSPIHYAQELNCPILVLQGDEDKVVPPNQSEAIANAAAKKGLPYAYVLFAGEQHGFRQTENIIRALQIELWFYGQVLGFKPVADIAAPKEAVGF